MTNPTDLAPETFPPGSGDRPADGKDEGPGLRRAVRDRRREALTSAATLAAFALIFTIFGLWLGSDFLDTSRRMFDISRNAPQLLISVGVVVCLAAHHFDLSVASMAALSGFLTIGLHTESG